jgi:hypothetical protein
MHDVDTLGVVGEQVTGAAGIVEPHLSQDGHGLLADRRIRRRVRPFVQMGDGRAGQLQVILQFLTLARLHVGGETGDGVLSDRARLAQVIDSQKGRQANDGQQRQQQYPRLNGQSVHGDPLSTGPWTPTRRRGNGLE